jgi:hypothetical protein
MGEAVMTVVFLLNCAPTRSLVGRTPYEAWYGEKPAVHFLCVFGCMAHVKVTKPNAGKLDDRSVKMVMIGYEPGSKAYRVFDPVVNRVHVTRDAVFEEDAAWDWSASDNSGDTEGIDYSAGEDTLVVEDDWAELGPGEQADAFPDGHAPSSPSTGGASAATPHSPPPGDLHPAPQMASSSSSSSAATSSAASSPRTPRLHGGPVPWQGELPKKGAVPVQFVSPTTGALETLDADDEEGAAHRFRIIDNLLYDNDELVADGDLLLAADTDRAIYI